MQAHAFILVTFLREEGTGVIECLTSMAAVNGYGFTADYALSALQTLRYLRWTKTKSSTWSCHG